MGTDLMLDRSRDKEAERRRAVHSSLSTFLIVTTVVLSRLPFVAEYVIDWDESTFILMAQSLLNGHLPFTELWDLKATPRQQVHSIPCHGGRHRPKSQGADLTVFELHAAVALAMKRVRAWRAASALASATAAWKSSFRRDQKS